MIFHFHPFPNLSICCSGQRQKGGKTAGNLNLLIPKSQFANIFDGRTIWHRTIWHRTIWHQDNLAPGQFGTGQFGTRTIWHQHNKNGQFGTGQFGTRTIWHQPNKADNLAPRKNDIQILVEQFFFLYKVNK